MQNAQHSALSPQHLNGWVSKFFVHYNGRKLGPYYARCWKENNKQKREYIKPADLERVREACQRYRDHRKAISNTTRDFSTLTGNLNYVARMAKRIAKGFLRPEDYVFIEKIKDNGFNTPGRPKLRSLPLRPQYRIPNTQDPKEAFMYPSLTNSWNCHPACPDSIGERVPESRDLPVHTSCSPVTAQLQIDEPPVSTLNAQRSAPRRILKPLRARLLKFMQDKLAQETEVEKCNRWAQEMKARPRPKPNIERALPGWITKEQVAADVERVRAARLTR